MADTDTDSARRHTDYRIVHLAYAAAIVVSAWLMATAWLISTATSGQYARPLTVAPAPPPPTVRIVVDTPEGRDGTPPPESPTQPDPDMPNHSADPVHVPTEPK